MTDLDLHSTGIKDAMRRRVWALCVLLGIFMIAMAFIAGRRATHDLTWGPYMDFDRDASFAQSVLEGHYGEDPLYKGEAMWFTPLMFTFEACASRITGFDIQLIQARAGAFLNLLVPIGFFIMVWYLFGPMIAVLALFAHLYLVPGSEPGWAVSTYSPWTLPMSFWQGPFYLLLIPLARCFQTTSVKHWLIMGAGVGVLFLGHAAPTIILVLMIAVYILSRTVSRLRAGDRGQAWRYLRTGVAAGSAFAVVTLPLTWYVVGTYFLDQKNRVPSAFTYNPLSLRHADLFVFHNLTWFNAVAIAGLVALVFSTLTTGRRIVLLWVGVSVFMALFAYAAVPLGMHYGLKLPMSVPSFHFYLYLKGAIAVGFGVAVAWLCGWIARRWNGASSSGDHAALVAVVVLFGVMIVYPSYVHRPDLTLVRERSLLRMADSDATDMYRHLVSDLQWGAVVLCDEELSLWIVTASARKTVATNSSMANPYVPPEPRMEAREIMLKGLAQEQPQMAELLDTYEVSHLIIRASDIPRMPRLKEWFPSEQYRNTTYSLFAR